MSVRWTVSIPIQMALLVAPLLLSAQAPPAHRLMKAAVPPAVRPFGHGKKLRAVYDSTADSTRLSVMTHKGKYFLWTQRPRLIWSVAYPGRTPDPAASPAMVELQFRTQSPQTALDSRLRILYPVQRELDVPSSGAYSDPGVLTWSHFMRFRIPCSALVEALASEQVQVSVGGISEYFQPDHLEALRDLLSRVGAWPNGCRQADEGVDQPGPSASVLDSTNSLSLPSDTSH
jgi:hypothetical protein